MTPEQGSYWIRVATNALLALYPGNAIREAIHQVFYHLEHVCDCPCEDHAKDAALAAEILYGANRVAMRSALEAPNPNVREAVMAYVRWLYLMRGIVHEVRMHPDTASRCATETLRILRESKAVKDTGPAKPSGWFVPRADRWRIPQPS